MKSAEESGARNRRNESIRANFSEILPQTYFCLGTYRHDVGTQAVRKLYNLGLCCFAVRALPFIFCNGRGR